MAPVAGITRDGPICAIGQLYDDEEVLFEAARPSGPAKVIRALAVPTCHIEIMLLVLSARDLPLLARSHGFGRVRGSRPHANL